MPNSIKIAKSASEIAKYKLNLKIMFTMSTFCQSPDIMSNPVTLITAKISFLVYCSLHVFKVSSMMEPLHSVFVSFWQWRSDDAKKFRNFEIYNLPPPLATAQMAPTRGLHWAIIELSKDLFDYANIKHSDLLLQVTWLYLS